MKKITLSRTAVKVIVITISICSLLALIAWLLSETFADVGSGMVGPT